MLMHIMPLIVVGAVSLAIILERTFSLYWKYSIDNHGFLNELKQKVLSNDMAGAIQYCSSQGGALSAKVSKAGLPRQSPDPGRDRNGGARRCWQYP
jgi:hypothetical protein